MIHDLNELRKKHNVQKIQEKLRKIMLPAQVIQNDNEPKKIANEVVKEDFNKQNNDEQVVQNLSEKTVREDKNIWKWNLRN